MSLQASNSVGVKVEPKFLRDPSTFESISSALYGLSSYIPSSLASLRKVAGNASVDINSYQNQGNPYSDYLSPHLATEVDTLSQGVGDLAFGIKKAIIVYAAFDEIESVVLGARIGSAKRSVLLLGYPDGFQIWDVTSPNNVREIVSIKNEQDLGEVTFLKVIPYPRYIDKDPLHEKSRPLVALVCKIPNASAPHEIEEFHDPGSRFKSFLRFFSLNTHDVIKPRNFENEGNVTTVQCNERVIVVALANPSRLLILSTLTLTQSLSPLTDVASHPTRGPIFSLGPRLLAYATTSEPSEQRGKKDGDCLLGEIDEKDFVSGKYQDVAKDVAKGVAKEVVNGVKLLGDYGYQTFSAYFSNVSHPPGSPSLSPTTMPINIKNGGMNPTTRAPFSPQASPSNIYSYASRSGSANSSGGDSNGTAGSYNMPALNVPESDNVGSIMIRDLGAQTSPQLKKIPPIFAHFKPHTHPVGHLSFNPSGTLLFSTSIQGHKFHLFEIVGKRRRGVANHKTIKHIYRLARGYTDASVGDGSVGWSGDSRWCAVASGRGTIHVFAINPYGGPPHVPSHIKGWVMNAEEPFHSSTQSPVIRIKPRTPLPPDPTDPANFLTQSSNPLPHLPINVNDFYSFPPSESNSSSAATSPARRSSPLNPNGNNLNLFNTHQSVPFNPSLTPSSFPFILPLRKPPGICVKLLPAFSVDARSGFSFSNRLGSSGSSPKRNPKRRSSPSAANIAMSPNSSLSGQTVAQERRRAKSWTQNSLSFVGKFASTQTYLGYDEDEEDIPQGKSGYQDILSFHPAGILTLHRLRMEAVLLGGEQGIQGKDDGTTMMGISGVPLTGSAAAVANMGRVIVGGAAGVVGMGMGIGMGAAGRKDSTRPGEPMLDLVVKYEDIVEWNLLRQPNWSQVKNVLETSQLVMDGENATKRETGKKWLAHAEIATHTISRTSLPPPLWLSQQFSFQTYLPGHLDAIQKGQVPSAKKLEIKREVVVEEEDGGGGFVGENGWVKNGNKNNGKVATAIVVEDGRVVGRVLEDISANISSAMHSSLDVKPVSDSFIDLKDSSLENTPLSFEDAFHVQVLESVPTIITTPIACSPSTSFIPDLINLTTPPSSFTSSPKIPFKTSSVTSPLSNHLDPSNSTESSPLQHLQPLSRSTSSCSIRTTTSTTAFSDDMEFISKRFDDNVDDGNLFFPEDENDNNDHELVFPPSDDCNGLELIDDVGPDATTDVVFVI
ncbi:hypothetical protein G9A89_013321 [Geosiphon pyriformis]|nr:hypothetical protein G9A89_013321 [Geosiphon pyriformis]